MRLPAATPDCDPGRDGLRGSGGRSLCLIQCVPDAGSVVKQGRDKQGGRKLEAGGFPVFGRQPRQVRRADRRGIGAIKRAPQFPVEHRQLADVRVIRKTGAQPRGKICAVPAQAAMLGRMVFDIVARGFFKTRVPEIGPGFFVDILQVFEQTHAISVVINVQTMGDTDASAVGDRLAD